MDPTIISTPQVPSSVAPDNMELVPLQEQDALQTALEQSSGDQLISEALNMVGANDGVELDIYPSYLDAKLLELIDAVSVDME